MQGWKSELLALENWDKPARGANPNRVKNPALKKQATTPL
jgi:hypothetical protein